jgi:hypothetical protein
MVRAKPILNVFGLHKVDMLTVYTGGDVITPEFQKENPAANILSDLFPEEKSFFKEKLGTSEKKFWQYIAEQDFSGDAASPTIQPFQPDQNKISGSIWTLE